MVAFRRVVAYAPPETVALGLGMASAVFRPRAGLTEFDFAICAQQRGPLATDLGVPIVIEQDLTALAKADLVLVLPGADFLTPPPKPVLDALRKAHQRGAVVAAHCVGVFALAAAGLLEEREATTHWRYADELASRYSSVAVRPEVLYLDQGSIVTGAGA